jgi:hypothetical protein
MPQCQRSPNNTVLPRARFEVEPGVIRCPGGPYSPGCPGGELYTNVTSGPLLDYLEGSIESCALRFGVSVDATPTDLWLGESPLTVDENNERWGIYLSRDSRPLPLRLQTAHESFHRVCGPGGAGHWIHEMLAEMFAIYRLRETGDGGYAYCHEAVALTSDAGISYAQLHKWTGGVDDAYYQRALVVGQELLDCCGWERVGSRSVVWVLVVLGQRRAGSAPPVWWAVRRSRR